MSSPYSLMSCRQTLWFLFFVAISMPSFAQTSISLNMDYVEGRYGETEKSTTWTMPFIIKHQIDPFSLKLYLPYVRASGLAASGGDRFSTTRQQQEGLGDIVATLGFTLYENDEGRRFDIGAKAKLATADKRNDLITTGKNDYTIFVDGVQPVGNLLAYGNVGWIKKGDPEGIDYRDPWFSTLGLSYRFASNFTVGLLHDYRQKVTPRGAPVSESTLYVEQKFERQFKLQLYVLAGHSTASPDRGAGATIIWLF